MSNKISNNVENVELSGIRKFYNKVLKVDNAVSLTLGQPDFQVPLKAKEAMIQAIMDGKTTYTSNAGIMELREEISKYLNEFNINFNADEICITVGGSEGLFATFTALINTGDKVLIPTPAYPAYESCVKILGGQVIDFQLNDEFNIDFDRLKEIISKEKPKIVVLSYPCNPTGAVLTKKDRNELYEIIKNEDIIVVSDEMYSSIYFGDKYYSIAQYNDIKDKVIFISGFSKMFSMTGLRIGYVCACKEYIDSIVKVHQYNVSCAPSIAQYAAYEGLKNCLEDVEYMKNEFKDRRDYVYNRLVDMGLDVNMPKGAFYIFPSIKKFNISSEEFCERLLNEAKVAIVPGNAFGNGGEGYIRISYCYSMNELEEALNRLEKFIGQLL